MRGDVESIELDLLLEALYRHRGYDFRGYARASLKRRVRRRVQEEGVGTIAALIERILHDEAAADRLLVDLSINVTAMFRDPPFFVALRQKVVPLLRTYPFVRVWNAGCSTGEETYSLAIALREEGLAERTRIYATDINDAVLRRAQQGTFALDRMRDYTRDYIRGGGRASFSDYYTVDGDEVRFDPELVSNVVFAQHNLVSDRSFNEFNMIVCRNVLIYFDRNLQDHVHRLFHDSLVRFGILALGHRESIRFTAHADDYAELDGPSRIYRRVA